MAMKRSIASPRPGPQGFNGQVLTWRSGVQAASCQHITFAVAAEYALYSSPLLGSRSMPRNCAACVAAFEEVQVGSSSFLSLPKLSFAEEPAEALRCRAWFIPDNLLRCHVSSSLLQLPDGSG